MECNPLAFDSSDVTVAIYQILEEVRSMKERFERSNEENKNLLETVREEVKCLRAEIKEMKMYADPEFKLLPNMPFESMEELREFDERLPQDDDMRSELKAFIQRLAGRDFALFLRTALRAVVTDELAVNLTWRGTPDKPSVQTFNVFVIIRDLCHVKYTSSNHAEINRICQQHFLHAKDRVNKKQRTSSYISVSSYPIKRDIASPSSPPTPPPPPPTPPTSSQKSTILPPLPITTLAALEEFDECLLSDMKTKMALKKFVNNINGLNFSMYARSAFKALITDHVAMDLSWRGTKEKPSIQDFTIFKIIKDACRKKFNETSDVDINRVCQQHFLHAKDRVNSKKIKLS